MRNFYKPGDHLVICQRSGQKALRSDCVKQWDGLIVLKEYAEKRHPLDDPPPPITDRPVMDSSPKAEDQFLAYGEVTREDL